jgi:hypothetical protein
MLTALQSALESKARFRIADVIVSIPHLVALYEDDISDACEYAGINLFQMYDWPMKLVWDSAPTFAGYGLGLCKHPQDDMMCYREWANMTEYNVLAVHYTHGALMTTYLKQRTCYYSYEPNHARTENFTIGFDAPSRISEPDKYWKDVRRGIRFVMDKSNMGYPEPDKVIVTGDAAVDDTFRKVLWEAMTPGHPKIYANDTVFAAAKSTAWLHMFGRVHRETRGGLGTKVAPSVYRPDL